MKRFLSGLLVITLCSQGRLNAQTKDGFEVNFLKSIHFFAPDVNSHSGNVILNGEILGGELAYKFNMIHSQADYIRLFNINSIDIAVSYRNLKTIIVNNDPQTKGLFGATYTLLARLNIKLLCLKDANLVFRPGLGVGYATQTYFTNNNPLITSHFNISAQAGLMIYAPINKTFGIQAGVDLLHFSNGAYRVPNNGFNSYNLSLGVTKKVGQARYYGDRESEKLNKQYFEIGTDIGRRGIFRSKNGFYKSGFFASYNYRVSPVLSIKAQLDAVYYYTVFDPQRYELTNQYFGNSYDRWKTGVSLGADAWLGKLAVTANLGYYLHNYSNYPIKIYWMPGLKYYIFPKVAIQAKSYINKGSADFSAIGFIFRIH